MYLAQGHNAAEAGLEPPTSRYVVRGYTTRPPCSPCLKRTTATNVEDKEESCFEIRSQ